jgi:hypothetical protein
MPKDEFDVDDPFELNGLAFPTHEDTTDAMAECFIEEFLRMRYDAHRVLALFRDPHYVGPNLAFERRGEPFVRGLIADVFARWGKPVAWGDPGLAPRGLAQTSSATPDPVDGRNFASLAAAESPGGPTDPMGAPILNVNR